MKVPLPENLQLSKFISRKPQLAQNTALHASSNARNSAFLNYAFPFHSTSFGQVLFQNKVMCDVNSESDFGL